MTRRQRKYYFTYKTTNTITGKWYIGMHSTDNLEDGYIGSGIYLSRSIKKYGKGCHKMEVLTYFEDIHTLREAERKLITAEILSDPMCMNLKEGGQGGWTDAMRKKAGDNKIQKISEDMEYRRKICEQMSNIAKTQKTAEFRNKISTVLKDLYKDPEFKRQQAVHRKKATIASHTASAKHARLTNRKLKYESGWRFMRHTISGKRKFMSPDEISTAILDNWVTSESRKYNY